MHGTTSSEQVYMLYMMCWLWCPLPISPNYMVYSADTSFVIWAPHNH